MAQAALYVIAVWLLVGMGFGLLATIYGAFRKVYRLLPGVGEFLDWFWFVLAAGVFVVVSFWTEWGIFRVWTIVFVLVGYFLWSWLASSLALAALSFLFWLQARAVHYLCMPASFIVRRTQHYIGALRNPPQKQ